MASNITNRLRRQAAKFQAEDGQGLAEYGLILGLIAIACIGGLTLMGSAIAGSSGFVDLPGAL